MAAITSAIALGLGAVSMGAGLYNQMEGREQAQQGYAMQQQGAQIQAEAARQQAQISKEQAAASVDYAGQNRDLNILAAQQSVDAAAQSRTINQNITNLQRQVEGQRMQAMELDASRKSIQVIRDQQRARALALTNATAQGASKGSGLQGGYGQISGQSNVNMLGIQQNLEIGRNIFGLNSQITDQNIAMSDLEYLYAQQRAANQTSQSNMMYDYAVTNAGFQTRLADTQTLMSQGQGYVNQGSGIVSMGQAQSSFGQSLFNAGPSIFSMGTNAGNVFGNFGGTSQPANNIYSPYYGPGF